MSRCAVASILPDFVMRQGFHHLGLLGRKMRKPPYGSIAGAGDDADNENDFEGIRYQECLSISTV